MSVSDTSGSTLDDRGKSESAGGINEGTGSMMVDEGRDGRRSAESLFLARPVPDSVAGSGAGRSVEVEVEFESVP